MCKTLLFNNHSSKLDGGDCRRDHICEYSFVIGILRPRFCCSRPNAMPKLYINRRAAADHKTDPSLDPDCKNSIFNQIYEGLKPRDRFNERQLDYRYLLVKIGLNKNITLHGWQSEYVNPRKPLGKITVVTYSHHTAHFV